MINRRATTPFTLEKPECCAQAATELSKEIAEAPVIRADMRRRTAALLEACNQYGYPPPQELVTLIRQVMKVPVNAKPRHKLKDFELFVAAAREHAKTGLTGRALARHLRELGHKASDRTIANWMDRTAEIRVDFDAFVKLFKERSAQKTSN